MNRYILIRRLRGPAFLLLVGMNALLAQAHILSWGHSWPFYLILAGVFQLAERAALASEGYPQSPGGPWPGTGQTGANQGTNQGAYGGGAPFQGSANTGASTGTAIVPSRPHVFENDREGGQS
jgi:hypothetical protein